MCWYRAPTSARRNVGVSSEQTNSGNTRTFQQNSFNKLSSKALFKKTKLSYNTFVKDSRGCIKTNPGVRHHSFERMLFQTFIKGLDELWRTLRYFKLINPDVLVAF